MEHNSVDLLYRFCKKLYPLHCHKFVFEADAKEAVNGYCNKESHTDTHIKHVLACLKQLLISIDEFPEKPMVAGNARKIANYFECSQTLYADVYIRYNYNKKTETIKIYEISYTNKIITPEIKPKLRPIKL